MSSKDRKKAANRQKRAANKQNQVAAKDPKAAAVNEKGNEKPDRGSASSSSSSSKPVDEDPDGEKLVKIPDPLGEAFKHMQRLLKYSPNDLEVQILAARLALRRNKYLQVVQALNRAKKLAPDHPEIHVLAVELGLAVANLTQDSLVTQLARTESSRLLGGKPAAEATADYLRSEARKSYSHSLAAAEALLKTDTSKKAEGLSLLVDESLLKNATVVEAKAGHAFVKGVYGEEEGDKFREKARKHFPHASLFALPKPPQPTPTPTDEL